jgi:signal transduction histidine kinase
MRLIFSSKNHNPLHCLVLIVLNAFYLLFFGTLGTYLAIFGWSLSRNILLPVWIFLGLENLDRLFFLVPFYTKIKWFITSFGASDYMPLGWIAWIVGMPLMVTGIVVFIIAFTNLLSTLTNSFYCLTHCPFCRDQVQLPTSSNPTELRRK